MSVEINPGMVGQIGEQIPPRLRFADQLPKEPQAIGSAVLELSDVLAADADWMKGGKCKDQPPMTDTFFPSDGPGVELAKRICEDCPVKLPCLQYALVNRIEHGVWGGKSERQRRAIKRNRVKMRELGIYRA